MVIFLFSKRKVRPKQKQNNFYSTFNSLGWDIVLRLVLRCHYFIQVIYNMVWYWWWGDIAGSRLPIMEMLFFFLGEGCFKPCKIWEWVKERNFLYKLSACGWIYLGSLFFTISIPMNMGFRIVILFISHFRTYFMFRLKANSSMWVR